jgi:hypothetical protein
MAIRTKGMEFSRQKLWEAELERVNSALRVVSKTNKSLHEVSDVVTWLNQVCQTAVQVGSYRMACVEFAEQDEQRTIRVVASAGFEKGYFETATLTWADEPNGRGPAGNAIRTGHVYIARNIPDDPAFAPWRGGNAARVPIVDRTSVDVRWADLWGFGVVLSSGERFRGQGSGRPEGNGR